MNIKVIVIILLLILLIYNNNSENFCGQRKYSCSGVYAVPANYAICNDINNKDMCVSKTNCKWGENRCKYYGEK